ncbi:MAG TPA: prolipoprotein diacylglyceryl transferase [Actinoallomurus sp.]|nr:prolipoprotein diacylglyceryl transferase [Actinoallomurus sp.]
MQQPLAYIPSPSQGVVHLGPLPLRGYALMIILGVIAAVWLGERRWVARGGAAGTVVDVAVWAVPFGLVGGRLYHVITDYQLYFGKNWHPIGALEVWNGGLGIWGAIAAGTLGGYIACRRRGVSLLAFADAAAPGIVLAQALGRWGNWFNQELYGRPTTLPWAVKIDPAHRPPNTPDIGTYHPTFLYESLWCVGVALLVIWAEKRFRLAYGRTFALYVAAYTVGRAWIEWLRVDSAHHILGLRLNDWTSLIVFLGAVAYLYFYRDRTTIPEGAFGTPAGETEGEDSADTAGESSAAAPDAPDAADTPDSPADDPETPQGRLPDEAETAGEAEDASEPAKAEASGADTDDSEATATEVHDEPAEANGAAADAGKPVEPLEPEAHDEAGEAEGSGEAGHGKDEGREKASTGGEPGERTS